MESKKSTWLFSMKPVFLEGEGMKWRKRETVKRQKTKQRQGEWARPGNTYLLIKPVICALTTGLPPATFPEGLSPTATRRSHETTPPFVSAFDLRWPDCWNWCLQPGKNPHFHMCVTFTGRWPIIDSDSWEHQSINHSVMTGEGGFFF